MASHTIPIPANIVRDILAAERSPVRFEQFCCDLFSGIEGIDYLPTSRSYDLSRDGRTLPGIQSGEVCFVCCGTESDFEGKVKEDLAEPLGQSPPGITPGAIHFCSNREKSEDYLQKVEGHIRQIAPGVPRVSAIGAYQIVGLVSQKHPEIFERRYTAELLEHREWLNATDIGSLQLQTAGMQIALTTQFHEDAQSLRRELIKTTILRSLSNGKALTLVSIAKAVSDALHLPKIINTEYFRETLIELAANGMIEATDYAYTITGQGQTTYADAVQSGNTQLINGKKLIQKAVFELLGYDMPQADFNRLWNRLQDEIANLFFANGLRLIRAIASLLSTSDRPSPSRTFSELLEGVRGSIRALGVGGTPQRRDCPGNRRPFLRPRLRALRLVD